MYLKPVTDKTQVLLGRRQYLNWITLTVRVDNREEVKVIAVQKALDRGIIAITGDELISEVFHDLVASQRVYVARLKRSFAKDLPW